MVSTSNSPDGQGHRNEWAGAVIRVGGAETWADVGSQWAGVAKLKGGEKRGWVGTLIYAGGVEKKNRGRGSKVERGRKAVGQGFLQGSTWRSKTENQNEYIDMN